MAVDIKNIVRLDIEDILEECRRQTEYAVRTYFAKDPDMHRDVYSISGNEIEQVFSFTMDAAAKIADRASMVKHHTQTGIDALTYYEDYEKPTEAASYDVDEETITTPEGATEEPVANIMASGHASGQKLSKGVQDTVIFEVTDLNDDQLRYTVVQQHIRTALVNYVLYKWFTLVRLFDLAGPYAGEFERAVADVRFNSAKSHARKTFVRKTRPSV